MSAVKWWEDVFPLLRSSCISLGWGLGLGMAHGRLGFKSLQGIRRFACISHEIKGGRGSIDFRDFSF
jgi:hypothetical protein